MRRYVAYCCCKGEGHESASYCYSRYIYNVLSIEDNGFLNVIEKIGTLLDL